jgi:toluene monooxygenase electron transfer component
VPEYYRIAYPDLRFERGYVHEVAARCIDDWRESSRAYIAGPPPAVKAALRLMVVTARMMPSDVRYDQFT